MCVPEIWRQPQQLGFLLDEGLVGAAGQVERQAAPLRFSSRAPGPKDEQIVRRDRARAQPVEAVLDPLVEPAEVFVLVPERFRGLAAPLADALGQLDHLVDGLLAVETHDVVEAKPAGARLGFAGQRRQHLDEHRHHHLRPALADQRQRAVEIEQNMADAGRGANVGRRMTSPVNSDFIAQELLHPGSG